VTVIFETRDYRGRPVRLFNGEPKMPWWHIEVERSHVLYDATAFIRDMKTALASPRLCHSAPHHSGRSRSRWIYYTCVTDAGWEGSALRVIVERRPKARFDVVITAFIDLRVDLAVFSSAEIEVGTRPDRDHPYLCLPTASASKGSGE
jgi:hypothetical protein